MFQILSAVHHAHMHCVMHRDLKPQNILVDVASGQVKVRPLCGGRRARAGGRRRARSRTPLRGAPAPRVPAPSPAPEPRPQASQKPPKPPAPAPRSPTSASRAASCRRTRRTPTRSSPSGTARPSCCWAAAPTAPPSTCGPWAAYSRSSSTGSRCSGRSRRLASSTACLRRSARRPRARGRAWGSSPTTGRTSRSGATRAGRRWVPAGARGGWCGGWKRCCLGRRRARARGMAGVGAGRPGPPHAAAPLTSPPPIQPHTARASPRGGRTGAGPAGRPACL
jgi:hypothetical protein